MLARVLLVVAALAAGTWLAVQERGARAEGKLIEVAFESRDVPPASTDLLTRARRWNPDTRLDLFEGVILARRGDRAGAIAKLQAVTREEPENLEAWGLLRSAAQNTPLADEAAARARALSPLQNREQ